MKSQKSDVMTILFWLNFFVFALHIMDETLMSGGFVNFIQRHFWPGFALNDFAVANAVWLILIGISNILYDFIGNRTEYLAMLPLFFVWERCLNGIFHIATTIWFKEYSPGLITSFMFFVLLYMICRFGVLKGHLRWKVLILSSVPAIIFEVLFISSMWWAH